MSDTSIDDLFNEDAPKAAKPAAQSGPPKPPARRKPDAAPKAEPKPKAAAEPTDNAVRIRAVDWECVCGNTNTLDLPRCGKCNAPRYS